MENFIITGEHLPDIKHTANTPSWVGSGEGKDDFGERARENKLFVNYFYKLQEGLCGDLAEV